MVRSPAPVAVESPAGPARGTPPTVVPFVDPTEVTPDAAPRECLACTAKLSVGERMFYFLEGADSVPLCRGCLTRLENDPTLRGPDAIALLRAAVAPPSATAGGAGAHDHPTDLDGAVRTYLSEELDRIAGLLERLPEDDPSARPARQLVEKVREDLGRHRLGEAVLAVGDLRRNLSGIERLPETPSPSRAPWDESVDELYERVTARARALARPPPTDEPDEPEAVEAFALSSSGTSARGARPS